VRDGNDDLDVVGDGPVLELRLGLDGELHSGLAVVLDGGLDPDERLDLCVEAVGHELEVSVGRDERDRAVVLEASQTHALVELDIIQLD
jgi:hypothetical protein